MQLGLALRAFFRVLFDRQVATAVDQALSGKSDVRELPAPSKSDSPPTPERKVAKPIRNDAISLLATLQREARFVDLVKESLDQYSDAQVGAAARDVLRDCAQVIDRLFDLSPVVTEPEGTTVTTPATIDSGTYRLSGHTSGSPPYKGSVVHHGWRAKQCQLPQWSGTSESALVIAPAEIEVAAS